MIKLAKLVDIQFEKEEFKKNIKIKTINEWVKEIFTELKLLDKSCSIFFCDSDTMKNLNNNYRGKNYVTDVLSFSQIEGEVIAESIFLGDVVICLAQAELQAEEQKHSLESEIKFLILHSILHLLGYDHESDYGEMEKKEKEIFNKISGEIIE